MSNEKREVPFFEDCSLTGNKYSQGVVTKYYRESTILGTLPEREYLCIEQNGNKVFLSKNKIDHLPEMIERWKIK